jgi:hypothetical protein
MPAERGRVAGRRRSRSEHLRRDVAECLLGVSPGDRMPTVRDLAARFGASLGGTQAVLARLADEGAVTTHHRGRSGAILESRSVGALWAAARDEPFVVALPLPSTRRIHALATAIKSALTEARIEAYLQFIRGSQQRLAALRSNRCHAIVMSGLAAGSLTGTDESIVIELSPGSYVKEHRVLYRADAMSGPTEDLRVGVDPDSVDFVRLTELEFPVSASIHRGSYMHLADLLNQGRIDVLIWDAEEGFAAPAPNVADRPLSITTLEAIGVSNTIAAVVARADDAAVAQVVAAAMRSRWIVQVQEDVLEGRRNAEY